MFETISKTRIKQMNKCSVVVDCKNSSGCCTAVKRVNYCFRVTHEDFRCVLESQTERVFSSSGLVRTWCLQSWSWTAFSTTFRSCCTLPPTSATTAASKSSQPEQRYETTVLILMTWSPAICLPPSLSVEIGFYAVSSRPNVFKMSN